MSPGRPLSDICSTPLLNAIIPAAAEGANTILQAADAIQHGNVHNEQGHGGSSHDIENSSQVYTTSTDQIYHNSSAPIDVNNHSLSTPASFRASTPTPDLAALAPTAANHVSTDVVHSARALPVPAWLSIYEHDTSIAPLSSLSAETLYNCTQQPQQQQRRNTSAFPPDVHHPDDIEAASMTAGLEMMQQEFEEVGFGESAAGRHGSIAPEDDEDLAQVDGAEDDYEGAGHAAVHDNDDHHLYDAHYIPSMAQLYDAQFTSQADTGFGSPDSSLTHAPMSLGSETSWRIRNGMTSPCAHSPPAPAIDDGIEAENARGIEAGGDVANRIEEVQDDEWEGDSEEKSEEDGEERIDENFNSNDPNSNHATRISSSQHDASSPSPQADDADNTDSIELEEEFLARLEAQAAAYEHEYAEAERADNRDTTSNQSMSTACCAFCRNLERRVERLEAALLDKLQTLEQAMRALGWRDGSG